MCQHTMVGAHPVVICGGKAEFCMCGRVASFLCDWKVRERKSGTCDKPICSSHAKQVAPGKHLCPFHQHQYDSWKRRHPERVEAAEKGLQQSLFSEAI